MENENRIIGNEPEKQNITDAIKAQDSGFKEIPKPQKIKQKFENIKEHFIKADDQATKEAEMFHVGLPTDENTAKAIHNKGLKDHYALKKEWSSTLKWLLCGMIGAQWALIVYVGKGEWNFSEYEWLLPTILVQNLAQIVSLSLIVVTSLFKDVKK